MSRSSTIQLIPARGRKRVCNLLYWILDLNSTHPRKGTETIAIGIAVPRYGNSTHPRKGTETRPSSRPEKSTMNSTHPRKGTETLRPSARRSTPKFNSSPQGDGNRALCRAGNSSGQIIQLIPARGRKPSAERSSPATSNSTHPRKGTETIHR